jgi:tyrosine-protein phosphatase SIW14
VSIATPSENDGETQFAKKFAARMRCSKILCVILHMKLRFRFRLIGFALFSASAAAAIQNVAAQTASNTRSPAPNALALGEKLRVAGVKNAGKISDVLFRGAQPTEQGFAELKKLGVTTVVDLRANGRDVTWERRVTESAGLRFVHIPVRGWSPPSDEQVAQFLRIFHDDPSQRVFVHCYYGDDRTGVMVAAYRITVQNWPARDAIHEMYAFGFHYHLYPQMSTYVRRFPNTFASDPTFAALHAASTQK